jgi:hypothetical protein
VVSTTNAVKPADDAEEAEAPATVDRSRRRFVAAATIGIAAVAIPYLWVSFVLWNGAPNLFRNVYQNRYGGNFYDLQARAMLAGHLHVPPGSLAIESWIHNGRDYTYFGLFPSLLRMPILALTHRFDGQLTAPSLLLAWLLTGVFSSMLLWRVRVMLRGAEKLSWTETVATGTLVATVVGGSVLVYLGANPYVYSEDKAWSVTLAVGSFLALLGVLERPSWGRVVVSAVLIVGANLTRVTEGYACVIGALLVAGWFALGRRGPELRRWWMPMAGVAVVSVAIGCLVTWAKFGVLFGLPVNDYTAFHVLNEQRINGGRYFDPVYLPTTLWTYLQPGGLRLTSLFPFITLPAGPTRAIGGVLFDNRTRTASVTASMPLLFLLSCLGIVSAFRRHTSAAVRMVRLLLVASAIGTGAVLLYGWIANRYLADFLPFLILASAVGAVSLWIRLETRSARARIAAAGIIVVIGLFDIAANVALSITPTDSWTTAQASRFLQLQKAVSDVTGHPLAGQIMRGTTLPYWAPADTVFIAGACNALYVSDGEDYSGVLDQRAEHRTWVLVEQGSGYEHKLRVIFGPPDRASLAGIPVATMGTSAVLIHSSAAPGRRESVWFTLRDPSFATASIRIGVAQGSSHTITLDTDRYAHVMSVSMDDNPYLVAPVATEGLPPVHLGASGPGAPITIIPIPESPPSVPLCRTLSADH